MVNWCTPYCCSFTEVKTSKILELKMFDQTHRTQSPEITPGVDAMVPSAAAAHCLQQAEWLDILWVQFVYL